MPGNQRAPYANTDSEIVVVDSHTALARFAHTVRPTPRKSLRSLLFSKNDSVAGATAPSLRSLTGAVVRSRTQTPAGAVDMARVRGPPRPRSHCEETQWHRCVAWEMRNSCERSGQRTGASDDR